MTAGGERRNEEGDVGSDGVCLPNQPLRVMQRKRWNILLLMGSSESTPSVALLAHAALLYLPSSLHLQPRRPILLRESEQVAAWDFAAYQG